MENQAFLIRDDLGKGFQKPFRLQASPKADAGFAPVPFGFQRQDEVRVPHAAFRPQPGSAAAHEGVGPRSAPAGDPIGIGPEQGFQDPLLPFGPRVEVLSRGAQGLQQQPRLAQGRRIEPRSPHRTGSETRGLRFLEGIQPHPQVAIQTVGNPGGPPPQVGSGPEFADFQQGRSPTGPEGDAQILAGNHQAGQSGMQGQRCQSAPHG
ncbi:MAG: hypothetical protein BWY56_02503 [Acidobacteria bacterium ADurb.Bin340]|nr:MAG: hypothetical protein BWY56_02503 [Acidobacteria bacterium ADurb.Bin340]